jgi:hypothetical protein
MRIVTLAVALMLCAAPVMAQHGRGNEHGRDNGRSGEQHQRRGPEPRHFSPNRHERIRAEHVRVIEGRTQIFFGGFWFGAEFWPGWIYTDDVYFTCENGIWFAGSWTHPEYILVQVNVIL